MYRSTFLVTACILLSGFGMEPCVDGADRRPNILLLFADDMGYTDLGCYGSEIDTPHLNRLAGDGLRFSHFYNAGRCCPSRASILTGLYSHQAGIGHMAGDTGLRGYRDFISFEAMTIPEVLGAAGYHTMMSGKWHLGWRDEGSPTARGFDRFYGTRGYVDSYYTIVPRTEIYLDDKQVIGMTEKPVNHLHPEREWYTTDVYTDYALHFIEEARTLDQPWFLYLAYNAPHFPLHAKPEDLKKYRGRYRDGGWSSSYGQGWANVSNTPFRLYKRFNHEGGISTPLIVHWPMGLAKPGRISHQVGHIVDILATCVDVARADYPREFKGNRILPMEGRSLLPVIRNQGDLGPRRLFWEHEGNRAVRDGDWKLVEQRGQGWELFNLAADRSETRNLADKHPEKVQALGALWEAWAERAHVVNWETFNEARESFRKRKR